MPPTFAYVMCLVVYLSAMLVGLAVCILLFLVPSKRRLALRLALAILLSLPGVFAFQFIVSIPVAVMFGIVSGLYAVVQPTDVVRWLIGLPVALTGLISVAAASVLGCYTGGSIGWQIGAGTGFRSAVAHQKIIQYVSTWLRRSGV